MSELQAANPFGCQESGLLVISWAYLILGLQQWCLLVCKQRDGAMDSIGMAGEMTHTLYSQLLGESLWWESCVYPAVES